MDCESYVRGVVTLQAVSDLTQKSWQTGVSNFRYELLVSRIAERLEQQDRAGLRSDCCGHHMRTYERGGLLAYCHGDRSRDMENVLSAH